MRHVACWCSPEYTTRWNDKKLHLGKAQPHTRLKPVRPQRESEWLARRRHSNHQIITNDGQNHLICLLITLHGETISYDPAQVETAWADVRRSHLLWSFTKLQRLRDNVLLEDVFSFICTSTHASWKNGFIPWELIFVTNTDTHSTTSSEMLFPTRYKKRLKLKITFKTCERSKQSWVFY